MVSGRASLRRRLECLVPPGRPRGRCMSKQGKVCPYCVGSGQRPCGRCGGPAQVEPFGGMFLISSYLPTARSSMDHGIMGFVTEPGARRDVVKPHPLAETIFCAILSADRGVRREGSQMFLWRCERWKNGQGRVYRTLVESIRTARGSRPRVLTYLGNPSRLSAFDPPGYRHLTIRPVPPAPVALPTIRP